DGYMERLTQTRILAGQKGISIPQSSLGDSSRRGFDREDSTAIERGYCCDTVARVQATSDHGIRLHVVRNGAFRRDEVLKSSIARIVATRFVADAGQIAKEFERRDTLYFLADHRDEILSFFLVSWGALEIDCRRVPVLNTGLTAAKPNLKLGTDPLW